MSPSLRSLVIPSLFALLATALSVGCAAPEGAIAPDDATAEGQDELIGRRPGNQIPSPHVKANATYLTARRVDTLAKVGALSGVALELASRVDGIIANQPADGRFSIEELLQIEKPGFVETLFPEEKAALPKVWSMLETIRSVPANVTLPALATLEAIDLSTPAGAPIKPAELDIATLGNPTLIAAAKRLQLTKNADGDASSVAEVDLDAAIATPGPYTPDEIDAFKKIKELFLARAGTSLRAKVQVTDPGTTTKVLGNWGPAKLTFDQTVAVTETRSRTFHRSPFGFNRSATSLDVTLVETLVRTANVTLPANHFLVILDDTSEQELVSTGGELVKPVAGASTIEVWTGGVRVNRFRARLPALDATRENKDLKDFADHAFVGKSGAPLFRNVVDAKRTVQSYDQAWVKYDYAKTAAPPLANLETTALPEVVTPTIPLASGRYELQIPSFGALVVDVYPEGFLRVTRPDGQTLRSRLYIWHNTQFDVTFDDRFRSIYNPQTGELNVFWDGRGSLFRGPITSAMRKG